MWIPPVHSPLTLGRVLAALPAAGNEVRDLERLLMRHLAAESVLLTASGTHALQVALELAAATQPEGRRRVALPAYACYDLASAVLATDLQVLFYDLDPTHLVPDPDSLRRAVDAGAGVVVAASLYGLPLDWDALRSLERVTEAVVIEDAAQAMGSAWLGTPAGALGELSVLSFGRGKGWTGSGGGALLARGRFAHADLHLPEDPSHPHRAALAARALAQWALARPSLYALPNHLPGLGLGETRFLPPTPAAAIHPYQAALAHRTRALLEWEVTVRRRNAYRLQDALASLREVQAVRPLGGAAAGWLRLPIRVGGLPPLLPPALHRLGVYRGYPRALPDLGPLVPRHAATPPATPGARQLVHELLTLPTHTRVPLARLLTGLPEALRQAL